MAFSRLNLIWRNLRYFRGVNLAVCAGMAVATAVLTGALMVGDSVRGSLRELALERLGKVDHVLIASRFFNQDLADRLKSDPTIGNKFEFAPALMMRGGASNEDRTLRTAGVQIAALGGDWAAVSRGKALVNGEIAAAIGITDSAKTAIFTLPMASDTPRDATLARRSRQEVITGLRLQVDRVVTEPGMLTLFGLQGSQRTPRNAWVNLAELQGAIDQRGRVNAMLVHQTTGSADASQAATLQTALRKAIRLDDYGLSTLASKAIDEVAITSRSTYIDPPIVASARQIATEQNVPVREVAVYLLNEVATAGTSQRPARQIHYAVAAGISSLEAGKLGPGEVAINQWTAEQLNAKVGDAITLKFYRRDSGGALNVVSSADRHVQLHVARILPMSGLGADPSLTPEFKGLTDAGSISDWDPPQGVDIDRTLVTKADEAYWKQYRASPKVFVSLETAANMWGDTYGEVTGLRVPAASSKPFTEALQQRLDPAALGLAFTPIKAQQIAAASGSTDFSMLFVAFSFFLIGAAALLVAMLFRLNVEQRARQVGLLSAIGFSPGALRRLALVEGAALALVGGLVGLAASVGYTWLMIAGLRTWWFGAVGTTALRLHIEPRTLLIGFAAGLLVAFCSVLWGLWRVGRTPPARLLAGSWDSPSQVGVRRGRLTAIAAIAATLGGVVMLVLGLTRLLAAQAAFLGGGTLLLAGSLCASAVWLRPRRREMSGIASLFTLAMRNATRHTGRSVLAVGLIAFAAFTLVTVTSMKQGAPQNTREIHSGAGGFNLILLADIPLLADLNTPAGRQLLGVLEPEAPLWQGVQFTSLRSWAGQDASCLNLTRPTQPTILAIPPTLAEQKRFDFAATAEKVDNPWDLLRSDTGDPSVVPVIADSETAQYILKLRLGGVLPIVDQRGQPRKLKLVGMLAHSIFQSELLMGEANFLRLFPSQSGFATVLAQTPTQTEQAVQQRLSSELDEYAVSVDTTSSRLAAYAEVANTYLSTFQTLGALGLMLGTIGLAVVLLRNVVERRSELALLAAIGFARGRRLALLLAENLFLLLLGLVIGTGCALLGIVPALAKSARHMNLLGLAGMLLAIAAIGLAGLVIAVLVGQRHVAPAALRAE